MKNFIKIFLSCLIIILFNFYTLNTGITQDDSILEHSQLKLKKEKNENNITENLIRNNFINDSPIQLGLEAGTSFFRKKEYYYLSSCVIGSMDINLYNKVVFLRLEIGGMFYNLKGFTRVSLGPNFKIYKTGKSRFFLSTSASFDVRTGGIIGTLEVSSRYVYLISKVFGISTSIRYPFWNTDSSGRGDPIIGIGVQLFTK